METKIDETSEYQDIEFNPDQHAIWRTLFQRQLPEVEKYACSDFHQGFKTLQLPEDHIPTIAHLNAQITPHTPWKTVRTDVRYTDAVPWYNHFARREFLITNYLRSRDELDFTPEPDMFHDIFGHLPYMTLPHYTALQDMFAPAFLRANDEQRVNIKRLAWYSTEFGLIREDGELKIFGTGLISSYGEMEHVLAGKTPIKSFTIKNVIEIPKTIFNYNPVLFEFDSIDALKTELKSYFDSI